MAKYIHTMPFWNFVKYILTPVAIAGETAILQFDGPKWLHAVVVVGFVLSAWVKFNIDDKNNNGIADKFENEKP
jgi:hypothetical protein